jgi:hypothetical protein
MTATRDPRRSGWFSRSLFVAPISVEGIAIRRDIRRRWLAGGCPGELCPDVCGSPSLCICPPCRCSACRAVAERARLDRLVQPPAEQLTLAIDLLVEDARARRAA